MVPLLGFALARADATLPVAGARCSSGSSTDCNPAGTTLHRGGAFVDPDPPAGWVQCAGFVNTAGDDVNDHFADRCLGATRLRLRVFDRDGRLEEDVYVPAMPRRSAWPDWSYLSGDHTGGGAVVVKSTHWTVRDGLSFHVTTDGRDSCGAHAAPRGTLVIGTGWCNDLMIAPGNTNDGEYRINNNGPHLPGRKIALYR